MPTIRPFRDIDSHDVINLFTFNLSGTYPALKGQFVKVISGWNTEQNPIGEIGDVGASYNNTVSKRYGLAPQVATCTSSGDIPIGLTLYDVREVDENGERLIFKPTKAAQMQVVLSGQAVPIATRGIFLYSGINGGGRNPVFVTAGQPAYLGIDGGVNTSGSLSNVGLGNVTRVGTFLGSTDANGWVLLRIDL
jgi:hypothetical protein